MPTHMPSGSVARLSQHSADTEHNKNMKVNCTAQRTNSHNHYVGLCHMPASTPPDVGLCLTILSVC